jgi:uncharacterized HAD superfamily protein
MTATSPLRTPALTAAAPARTLDIGVDLDGVCYDFVTGLRQFIHATTARPLESMPPALTWNFHADQWGLSSEEFMSFFADGVNAGHIFRHGDAYPGTVSALRGLAADGHRVHIVTARRIKGAEAAAEASTVAWLAEQGIEYESLTFTADKDEVSTDIFVEDHTDNYDVLDAAGNYPWLITRPWNHHHRARRVDSLDEFARVARRLAAGDREHA